MGEGEGGCGEGEGEGGAEGGGEAAEGGGEQVGGSGWYGEGFEGDSGDVEMVVCWTFEESGGEGV